MQKAVGLAKVVKWQSSSLLFLLLSSGQWDETGVDGKTYFNECLAFCQEVEVDRPGVCGGSNPITANDKSFIREGKVSKEKMDKFKEQKVKYVAKRRFSDKPFVDQEPIIDPDASPSDEPASLRAIRVTSDGDEYVSDEIEFPETDDDGGDSRHFVVPRTMSRRKKLILQAVDFAVNLL